MFAPRVRNRTIIIGLTGGIGSGKSTACRYLKRQGIPVIDSDEIVRDLWVDNQEMLSNIRSVFHTTDKRTISSRVFSSRNLRDQLNAIIHPYVFKAIDEKRRAMKDEKIIVIDMPLLFEVGYQSKVDYTALVYADHNAMKSRIMMRDHISDYEAENRIAAQIPIDRKRKLADFVLDNMRGTFDLYQAIDKMLRRILNEE